MKCGYLICITAELLKFIHMQTLSSSLSRAPVAIPIPVLNQKARPSLERHSLLLKIPTFFSIRFQTNLRTLLPNSILAIRLLNRITNPTPKILRAIRSQQIIILRNHAEHGCRGPIFSFDTTVIMVSFHGRTNPAIQLGRWLTRRLDVCVADLAVVIFSLVVFPAGWE